MLRTVFARPGFISQLWTHLSNVYKWATHAGDHAAFLLDFVSSIKGFRGEFE